MEYPPDAQTGLYAAPPTREKARREWRVVVTGYDATMNPALCKAVEDRIAEIAELFGRQGFPAYVKKGA